MTQHTTTHHHTPSLHPPKPPPPHRHLCISQLPVVGHHPLSTAPALPRSPPSRPRTSHEAVAEATVAAHAPPFFLICSYSIFPSVCTMATPSSPSSSSSAAAASSRNGPSVLPPTDNEISATAQALLEAHRQRLRDHTFDGESDSAIAAAEQQVVLAALEQQIANADRVALQLENLTVMGKAASSGERGPEHTILQPLGPLAFWSATVADHQHVFVRQSSPADSSKAVREAKIPPLTRIAPGKSAIQVEVKDEKLERHAVTYERRSIQQAIDQLQSDKAAKKQRAASLRQKLTSSSAETLRQSLKEALAGVEGFDEAPGEKPGIVVNEKNQVLNEEGLPFFEPMEPVPDSPPLRPSAAPSASTGDGGKNGLSQGPKDASSRPPGLILPFQRSAEERQKTKEERRKWMDEIFGKLEKEEENRQNSDDDDDGDEEGGDSDDDDDDGGARERSAMQVPSHDHDSSSASEDEGPLSPRSPLSENRVVLRRPTPTPPDSPTQSRPPLPEISSAARPPPPRSALKQQSEQPSMTKRPSFGSSGIRRGFLNLNPSSPGAIRSNFAAEDLMPTEERRSRPLTVQPLDKSVVGQSGAAAGSSAEASGASTPSKKTVRIQSPERFREPSSALRQQDRHSGDGAAKSLSALQRALKEVKKVHEKNAGRSGETAEKQHADDVGVEEEAARIVDLLGPGIVEGHPGAPAKDVLDQMQRAFEEDKRTQIAEALAERQKREEEEREFERKKRLAEKPALGQTVVERQPGSSGPARGDAAAAVQKAKASAFKRGFLNQKPSFVPVNPPRARDTAATAAKPSSAATVPPTQSLGMSALDRAGLGDDDLSRRRQQMGLPAAVPHARPSKAYAEKMAKRQQGVDVDAEQDADAGEAAATKLQKEELARPTEGDDQPREGRVRFAPAPTESADAADAALEEEERANEINPSAKHENAGSDNEDGEEVEDEIPIIRGEGADADDVEVEGEHDDDDDDDFDDEGYDTDDLLDLEPDMDYDVEAAFDDSELMREYAKAKAVLQELGLAPGGSQAGGSGSGARAALAGGGDSDDEGEDDDDDDYEDDIVPLDATVEDQEYQGNTVDGSKKKSKLSRFKADLANRSRSNANGDADADEAGHQLAHLLANARNLGQSGHGPAPSSDALSLDGRQPWPGDEGGVSSGPVMIIPQLAPIKFAKGGDLVEGRTRPGPVELVGPESDEEDTKAELTMRSRLERMQWKRDHPEEAKRLREKTQAERSVREGTAPPAIRSSKGKEKMLPGASTSDVAEVAVAAPPVAVPVSDAAVAPTQTGAQEEAVPQPAPPKKVSRFKAARMAG
ncbi:hypothetical protein ACQY0O_005034 [Thecaphora frezii]